MLKVIAAIVMTRAGLAIGALLLGGVGSPSRAATIANQSSTSTTVTIVERSKARDVTLMPGQVATEACEHRCIVRLGNNKDSIYTLEPDDAVVFEHDALFYNDTQSTGAP